MRRFVPLTLFLLAATLSTASQEGSPLLFVSRLSAQAEGSTVVLTWSPPAGYSGELTLFRYTEEIAAENLNRAELLDEVGSDQTSYRDLPPEAGKDYYYGVFVTVNGKPNEVFIPFRNITTRPVRIEETVEERQAITLFTELRARAVNDAVELTYRATRRNREILIYRDTEPVTTRHDLVEATLIATSNSSKEVFRDYPIPGVTYFYALIDSARLRMSPEQDDSFSYTEAGVTIELAPDRGGSAPGLGTLRAKPLPYLSLSREFLSDRDLPRESIISETAPLPLRHETVLALNEIASEIEALHPSVPSATTLPPDIQSGERDPNYALFQILSGPFAEGDWRRAENELNRLGRLSHPAKIEARIHFYLGQTLFFQERFRDAFLEFLMANNHYYRESSVWLDRLYRTLRRK